MTGRLRLAVAAGVATLLGCAPLAPMFDSWAWVRYAILTVGAIAASSVVARRLSVPGGFVPLINIGVLVLLVSALFGAGAEILGILPTSGTLRALHSQVTAAFTDISQLAVPVPARRGLMLITVVGVGAVAILIDALAVTLRRAALAGLPMLAMFAVPVAVARGGIGWLPFVFGAAGYLVLLLSEGRERVSRWGRPFSAQSSDESWRPDPLEGAPMAAVGRRIGAAAIGVAVLLPAFVPFVHSGGLAGVAAGAGVGTGIGGGGSGQLNPITQLRGQLRRTQSVELLRVKTNDRRPFYLRVTTLDLYNQAGWGQAHFSSARGSAVRHGLPETGIGDGVRTKTIKTRVEVRGLGDSQFLPVYATPTKVSVKGDWLFDRPSGTVFSNRTNARDLNYTFTSVTPDQSSDALLRQLKAAPPVGDDIQIAYGRGAIPREPRIQGIVNSIVSGKSTPYAKTLALYEYFRDPKNGFRYTTATKSGTSGSDLLDFLTNKQGYCEQYASAMAVMARYASLPARVAIGYTKGVHKKDYWSVGTNDAHAWVEIYFDGIGWVPWDPTPLGEGGRATTLPYAAAGPNADRVGALTGSEGQLRGLTPDQRAQFLRDRREAQGLRATAKRAPVAIKPPPVDRTSWWIFGGVLALILLVAPSIGRLALRRWRWSVVGRDDPRRTVHAAWDEVLATAYDLGLSLDDAETPRATAARLSRECRLDDSASVAVRRLSGVEERARYSDRSPTIEGAALTAMTRAICRALSASATRWVRLRAWAMPPSVISAASRRGGLGISDTFDRVDTALARARRILLGRFAVSRSA